MMQRRNNKAPKKPGRATQLAQQCFAVKPGIDEVLDIARRRFSESIDSMFEHCDHLRASCEIPSLRLSHDTRRGYYLTLDGRHTPNADPGTFVQRSMHGPKMTCTTRDLKLLDSDNRDAVAEVLQTQDRIVVQTLVQVIRQAMARLHVLSDAVALIDLLCSHAAFAERSQRTTAFVPPELVDRGSLILEGSVLPSLGCLSGGAVGVRHDFAIDAAKGESMSILTGPNASGKSTLLREVAQCAVLAHIGCPVPAARRAAIPLLDRICVRMSPYDVADASASSFMREMADLSCILRRVTNRSLVLIDELGRSTSTTEGASVAWAVAEWLADLRCPTIFATHFIELPKLSSKLPNVRCDHLVVEINPSIRGLRFDYKIAPGPCSFDHYGIALAETIGFPEGILRRAHRLLLANQPLSDGRPRGNAGEVALAAEETRSVRSESSVSSFGQQQSASSQSSASVSSQQQPQFTTNANDDDNDIGEGSTDGVILVANSQRSRSASEAAISHAKDSNHTFQDGVPTSSSQYQKQTSALMSANTT